MARPVVVTIDPTGDMNTTYRHDTFGRWRMVTGSERHA